MKNGAHLQVLDGWRGLSIVLVLMAHLVPLPGPRAMSYVASPFNAVVPEFFTLDPQAWNVNGSIGIMGMVLFFNLSGFLITGFLLKENATVPDFLIRRFFRIVPLAWLYLLVALTFSDTNFQTWAANYLFYANLPPTRLLPFHDHLWSLCVEVQFYVGVAALFYVFRARGLLLLPIFCVFFTLLRVINEVFASSVTYFRIDEILAGCVLALVFHGRLGRPGEWLLRQMKTMPQWPLVVLLMLSCFHQGGWLVYLRPYIAAMLIGASLFHPDTVLVKRLQCRLLIYLAAISYALYVLHLGLTGTWLGSGDIAEKYLKRPLFFIVLFVLAHVSTYYYEHRWIAYGKWLSENLRRMQLDAARPGSR